MHYAFDIWMAQTFPDLPWCRYADDGLVHCRSESEAPIIRETLQTLKLDLLSAVWNCIPRRRKSSTTARMIGTGTSTRLSHFTFSVTVSGRDPLTQDHIKTAAAA
jgi:hypothetical protein